MVKIEKRTFLTALLVLIGIGLWAQGTPKYNIEFKGCSFEEAIKIAQKEEKKIFVDCYTVWCGPCKALAKNIFTQQPVADFYNKNFINLKMDMEKGEGIALAKKWGIASFPTLIYFDSEGEEVHRKTGGGTAEHIIATGKIAVSETGIGTLARKFNNGERSEAFITQYLAALKKGRKVAEMEATVVKLLNEQPKSSWTNSENWLVFDKYFTNINTPIAEHFLRHRYQYIKSVGKEAVDKKVLHLYKREMFNGLLNYDGKTRTWSINKEAYTKYLAHLDKFNIEQKDLLLTHIDFRMAGADVEKCIAIVDNYIQKDKSVIGTEQMYEWSCMIRRKHFDEAVVKKSNEWFNLVINNTKSEELKKRCKDLMEGKVANPYGGHKIPAIKKGSKKQPLMKLR